MHEIRSPFVRSILERSVPSLQSWPDAALHAPRNALLRGAIDALAANVPSLHRLLGSGAFDEVAAAFVRAQQPRPDRLLSHGTGLPEFLASYPSLVEHDYLPGVAALDLAWIESHLAAEAPVLRTEDVFALTAEQLLHGRLVVHPATRWLTFAVPAFTIWRRQREERLLEEPLAWRGESALLVRARGRVDWCAIELGEAEFLAACAAGRSCNDALESVLAGECGFDLAVSLPRLLR
ncbi:MAG: putative DNA-binding domain-containing protein, partial [Rhizobacter sp.]|nr:putative DNA-binding domain-containing protein [Rhizobacter sp.]